MAKAKKTVTEEAVLEPKNEEVQAAEIPAADVAPETSEAESKAEKKKGNFYTEEEINALVKNAVKEALAYQGKSAEALIDASETVTLLFIGGIAPGTTVTLDGIGKIPRDGNILTVSKRDFLMNLGNTTDLLMRKRKLIVLEGLTDEERVRYGVKYEDGELMTQETYQKLLDLPADKLVPIFSGLCEEHKMIVRRVFRTAGIAGDGRVSPEKLKVMIKLDRAAGIKESPLTEIYKRLAVSTDFD